VRLVVIGTAERRKTDGPNDRLRGNERER